MACVSWDLRASCVVASSWRAASARASFSDSSCRACSGFLTAGPRALGAAERQFVHALLNSGVCVDQTFAGVTHSLVLVLKWEDDVRIIIRVAGQSSRSSCSWQLTASGRNCGCAVTAMNFPSRRHHVVPRSIRRPDAGAGARMACHRARRIDARPGADRQRQDPGGVPGLPGSPDVRAVAGAAAAMPGAVRLAAEGAGGGRRAQPACANRRHQPCGRRARRHVRRPRSRDSHRRHAAARSGAVRPRAGRHPDHHARVVVPDAGLPGPRGARIHRHGHRRRDPLADADQARRASGDLARAARASHAASVAAHRAVGHGASDRRGHAISRRRGHGRTRLRR